MDIEGEIKTGLFSSTEDTAAFVNKLSELRKSSIDANDFSIKVYIEIIGLQRFGVVACEEKKRRLKESIEIFKEKIRTLERTRSKE